jgi:two-component SAPR family response regulator
MGHSDGDRRKKQSDNAGRALLPWGLCTLLVHRDTSVQVKLLGRPHIQDIDEKPGGGFGAKSREFLFLFLLNPEGLTREEAIELLWPETETEQGIQRFKFQLRTIRQRLRNDLTPTAKFIDKFGDVYKPVPEHFSVDVWDFDQMPGRRERIGGCGVVVSSGRAL